MARARSRKRRPAGAGRKAATGPGDVAVTRGDGAGSGGVAVTGRDGATGRERARASTPRASPAKARGTPRQSPTAPHSYGERPPAPLAPPLPLSEGLILAGAVGAAIGFAKSSHGFSDGGPAVLAGIGAVALGTIEVTVREHRSGYRSHTVMLALDPGAPLHHRGGVRTLGGHFGAASAVRGCARSRRRPVRVPLQTAPRPLPRRAPRASAQGRVSGTERSSHGCTPSVRSTPAVGSTPSAGSTPIRAPATS